MTERNHREDAATFLAIAGRLVRVALQDMDKVDDLGIFSAVPETMLNISAQLSGTALAMSVPNGEITENEHMVWEQKNEELVKRALKRMRSQ